MHYPVALPLRIGTWDGSFQRPALRGVSRSGEGHATAVLAGPKYMSDLDVGDAPGGTIVSLYNFLKNCSVVDW